MWEIIEYKTCVYGVHLYRLFLLLILDDTLHCILMWNKVIRVTYFYYFKLLSEIVVICTW